MRKLLFASLIAGVLVAAVLVAPGFILAGGPTVPSSPPMPPLHRHYIVLPDGTTQGSGPTGATTRTIPPSSLRSTTSIGTCIRALPGFRTVRARRSSGTPAAVPSPQPARSRRGRAGTL